MIYLVLIILLAFLPIALWGYFLSYFENTPFHARRFVLGIVAGGISVAPILGIETVFSWIGVERFNPFGLAASSVTSGANMIIGLELFVLVISLFILFCGGSLFFENTLKTL